MDLACYAARIGYGGEFRPTCEVLRALHFAHTTHIPFENLDVLLRRPIRLDAESLWRKLVLGARGGYCFEQNTLFANVLEAAGFRVSRLAARVRVGAVGVRARTHMLLLVEAEGERWVADVGFGADGLLHPMRFAAGEEDAQFGWHYGLEQEGKEYVLRLKRPAGWVDLYAFGLEEQYPIDYEVANHYTSTYPESMFVRTLRVQLSGPETRLLLLNRTLIERRAEGETKTPVAGDEEILRILAERFELVFPPETRFPFEEI